MDEVNKKHFQFRPKRNTFCSVFAIRQLVSDPESSKATQIIQLSH